MSPQLKRLTEGLSYFFLTLTIVSAIGTVISGFFAYGNEVSLSEAIRSGQVRADIRGMAEDGRFTEPMLVITLTKQIVWPVTVVIEQGLTLEATEGEADLVMGQTEKITLFRSDLSTTLLAYSYSLDYSKPFPNSGSKYEPKAPLTSQDLGRVFNNIAALEAEEEIASQLAVWTVYNNVKIEKINSELTINFSTYVDRVNEIRESDSLPVAPPSNFRFWLVIFILSSTLTIVFGRSSQGFLLFWKGPNTTVSDAARDQPDDETAGVKPLMIDHLDDWKLLAKGGMAEIWTAVNQRGGEKVVVKFPRIDSPPISPDNIKFRFKTEITHHKKMSHPNIVIFLEHGECIHPRHGHETAYLIQEFINGRTILQMLHKNGYRKLDDQIISKIVDEIIEVFKYIHKKKVVHRDITWKNVMVDHRGEVYLIDFGNATEFGSTDTTEQGLCAVGTPLFHAPLKEMGNIPDRDFYSLVMLIYAMYAGKPIIGLSEEQVEQDMRQMYNNLNGLPRSVRKALEWRLKGDYGGDRSTEIRRKHFPTVREMMMEMIKKGAIQTKIRENK